MPLSDTIVVMREGKVEQMGPPEEIYARPATLFVADFIGEANFIESRVLSSEDGEFAVDLWGVAILLADDGSRAKPEPGAAVSLIIRPEAIELTEDVSGFGGEMRKAVYTGASMQYDVEVNGILLSVADNSPVRRRTHAEGDRVGIRFLSKCFHVLLGKG